MSVRRKEPFDYKNKQEFQAKLVEWIGDVLYDFFQSMDMRLEMNRYLQLFKLQMPFVVKKFT